MATVWTGPELYQQVLACMTQVGGTFPALSDNVKKSGGGKKKPRRK